MKRSIATITLNPAYDLVGFCARVELGEVNLVNTTGLHAAGKGINVAKVLTDLGVHVVVGGLLGEANKEGFLQLFAEYSMENHFQLVEGRTRINVKLTEQNDAVTDLNFSGFTVTSSEWQHFVNTASQWLSKVDMIIVSGSLPQGIEPNLLTDWLSHLKTLCPYIIFDSNRAAFTAGLKAQPWLIKPNRHELEEWVGHALPTIDDVIDTAQHLRKQGIAHIIVSLGGEGAVWLNEEGAWLATPPKCQVVSTVGAGDSMVAGLAYGLLSGKSVEETFRLATAVAAMAVSQSNVGVTDQAKLATLISHVSLQPLNYTVL